ncbi:MAG: sulfatase-like hydrolase/transferase [Anaerovoracaceae bacterium]|jgi:phosphoglycerol transferase MdoB-like AlkP superfamily enzyme
MDKLKKCYRKYLHNYIGICVVAAILLNLFIETLARQSAAGGLLWFLESPVVFLFNTLLIFVTLSFTMLFRHKAFALVMMSGLWVLLGVVNGVILGNRMTPFTTYDIMEIKDGFSLINTYFSTKQIVLFILGMVALILTIIILFRKLPVSREKIDYKRGVAVILLICGLATGGTLLATKAKLVDTHFPNLAYGYRDNGFVYCFLATWLAKGVGRPAGYSEEMIRGIFTDKELETTVPGRQIQDDKDRPNIVFLQLESFMDPSTVKGITLSKDPIPNYRKLMKDYSSGRLHVPSMGAGTANTEFEAMTGMNTKFFGPGEYPYKSIIVKKTCESIPYNLKEMGYSTHALHNYRAAFYKRNEVFVNLGYDTFTSLEYMSNISKTPKKWAKDYVLTGGIMDALRSSPGKDYIYAISVQGHGKYPTEEVLKEPKIRVLNAPSQELKWAWEYYVNQIYEMDDFVKQLLAELEKYDEKVIVVMYGDHLPAIDNVLEENLKDGRNTYQTDYVIWSNFKMDHKKKDYYAYQLGPEVLDRIGIHNGTFVTYHQKHQNSKTYMEDLKALQYDMLYGKRYIYKNVPPLKGTKMKMGVADITIEEVVQVGEKYYIKGRNFTEYSKINLDGKILDTVYLGPTILGLKEEVDPKDVSKMKVSQVEKDNKILSTTE